MTKQDASSKGHSKVITPEMHAAARKAAQLRKRRNHTTPATTPGMDRSGSSTRRAGFAWSREDYRNTPLFLANRAPQKDGDDFDEFAAIHAGLALKHPAVATKLATGSPARTLVVEALSLYPLTKKEGTRKRSNIAIEMAVEALTPKGTRLTEGVVTLATRAIKVALRDTFEAAKTAKASKPLELASA